MWSLAIPGFGQLYNGDYLIGLALVVLEFTINVYANINLAILYSFRGQILAAAQIANYQWILFYPCVYCFALWQAYNKAIEINHLGDTAGSDIIRTSYNGVFIGAAFGGTLGVIYSLGCGPIFGGIAGMLAGALIGWIFEKLALQYNFFR